MPELTPEQIQELREKVESWNERDRKYLNRFESLPPENTSSGKLNVHRIYREAVL